MNMSQPTNNPPKPERCSPAMARVLINLYQGRQPWGHLSGRSMYGGAGQTERALRQRGWIDASGALTDAGRERAADLVPAAAPAPRPYP